MNITVCVMLPERGSKDYSASAHSKWGVLSPLSVSLMGDTSQPVGALRTGYVHVTGVPVRPGWAAMTQEAVLSVLTGRICKPALSAKRQWVGRAERLPKDLFQKLLQERQVKMNWGQFKTFFRNVENNLQMTDEDLG